MVISSQDIRISMGELNRNIKDTVRDFAKIITGQEINNASDDSAKYSMSEKMRAKIRALEQGQQNAQNGIVMLTIAQEGIQEQLDILKTIKLRALQAADASASDEDRQWLQKEIEDGFKQIDNIAYDIELNGINLLTGNVPIRETTVGWKLLLTPQILEDSDMHLINDVYSQLDGLEGPFDAFSRYQSVETTSTLLNGNSSANLSGGTDGISAVFQMDFSDKSVSDLGGKAFQVRGVNVKGSLQSYYTNYAVIDSNDTTQYNTSGFNVVTVNSATMSMSDALNAIADKVNSVQSSYIAASVDGDKINFTPVNTQTESNNARIQAVTSTDSYTGGVAGREGATATGLNLGNLKTSGGTNATYKTIHYDAYTDEKDKYHPARDERVEDTPATKATMSFNASGAANGSGIYFNGTYIKFVTDSSDPNYSSKTAGEGVTKIGLGWSGSFSTSSFNIQVNNGQFNITARYAGANYNNYGITDGFAKIDSVAPTFNGHGLQALGSSTQISSGVDGERATYDMDLTPYDTTDQTLMENFIDELLTGSLHLNYKQYAYSSQQSIAYEFIDTKVATSLEAKQRLNNSIAIDLNDLRNAVAGGKTIADAFIDMMTAKNSRFSKVTDNGQKILRTTSTAKGIFGNEDSLNTTADQLSHYTLDFKKWLQENGSEALKNLTRYLDGKGFRFYCATDTEHWFNFVFTGEAEDDRPAGISGAHLETIPIDVSGLKDITPGTDPDEIVRRLVETIYEQANPYLVADDHNLYLASNPDEGTITVYDERKEDVLLNPTSYPNVRETGAKIGDGVLDDVQKTTVTVAANQRQLAIQHTAYSSQNILLHIPQTTINHIFSLDPDWPDYSLFNVTTQTGRNYLLGKTNSGNSSSAALNKGLEFLFNALTTVSAQNSMVRVANDSLFMNYENEIAAESKIRDSDLAKSFVDYTKSNMLAKAAETMLAQANQNASKIIELLDRSKPAADKKSNTTDKKSADKKSDAYKNSAVTDKKPDDKKSAGKKASDKKSALLGQIGTFATQRDKNTNKNSSPQKSSTDKKIDTTAKKNLGKK